MNSALKNPRRIMSRVRALAGACLIGLAVGAIARAAVSRTSDVMIVESPSGELPMVSDACQGGVLIFRSEVDHNGVAWAVESASVKNGRLYLKVFHHESSILGAVTSFSASFRRTVRCCAINPK